MATTKKKGKAIQFQIGWAGLIAITVSCVCVLLWTFVLGFWMGQKVATGNSSKPKVSVYEPGAQGKPETDREFANTAKTVDIAGEKDNTALKEFSALKESLKEEASKEGIKTEVLSGPEDIKGLNGSIASHGKVNMEQEKTVVKQKELSRDKVSSSNKKEQIKKEHAKKASKVKTEKIADTSSGIKRPFSLQIASYRTITQARKEAARWRKKGYFVRVKSANLGRKGIWYRVYLGRYRSLEEAKRASVKLASKEGIRSYVTKVSK